MLNTRLTIRKSTRKLLNTLIKGPSAHSQEMGQNDLCSA